MSKTVIVRYKTKADRGDENEGLVRQIFDELADAAPDGVRYTALRLDDGVSFIHIATIEALDGPNPILTLPAFVRFQEKLAQRCEEPPAGQGATTVGSYRAASP
jgi:hypothetical protein